MATKFENFGLTEMVAKHEDLLRLCSLTMAQGQRVRAYTGDYFRMYMGDAISVVRVMPDPDTGDDMLLGIDTHAVSDCEWDCEIVADVTPDGADTMARQLLVRVDGCEDIASVSVLCSQVVPSLAPGKRIRLNMAALPMRVVYSEKGTPHVVEPQEDTVVLQGTVKDVRVGEVLMGMELISKYISATVTTSMGDLELCHSLDVVPEEQKDLVKVGAAVSAVCVLSGDAAVGEYAGGITYGEEQDLALLADIFTNGNALRAFAAMHMDCAVTFMENRQEGTDLSLPLLLTVADQLRQAGICRAVPARITGVDETGENIPKYTPGKRCLLLGDEQGRFAFLCYIDVNSLGRITELIITNDSRYDVEPC